MQAAQGSLLAQRPLTQMPQRSVGSFSLEVMTLTCPPLAVIAGLTTRYRIFLFLPKDTQKRLSSYLPFLARNVRHGLALYPGVAGLITCYRLLTK